MISDDAVEAAAKVTYRVAAEFAYETDPWDDLSDGQREAFTEDARKILEAAAPYMLSHEREETRLAHLDAMVNRETKQSELAAAWDDGHSMGWNEATANTIPERDSLWRNPHRSQA